MPENIQMICLVRLIVVEQQTRMKGTGSRTHMMVSLGAALMTLVSLYGFLPIVGAAGITATALMLIAQVLLRGVERREKMQVTELAVGLTDGKGDLVRLYDWLEQRKITVREIDLKRQEGISIKRISCGCRRISRVCSRLRYKRNSKAVRQKCRMAFVLIQ